MGFGISFLLSSLSSLFSRLKNARSVGLLTMLQNAAFMIRLLPRDACPHLISMGALSLFVFLTCLVFSFLVLTDGGLDLQKSESSTTDNLLMLLNREDIACSIIRVGDGYNPHCCCIFVSIIPLFFNDFFSVGYLANEDLLKHITVSTFGYLLYSETLEQLMDQKWPDLGCQVIQRLFLLRKALSSGLDWKKDSGGAQVLLPHEMIAPNLDAAHSLMTKKVDYPYLSFLIQQQNLNSFSGILGKDLLLLCLFLIPK